MTKKQLVEQIQVAEAKAWQVLQDAKKLWGDDDAFTQKRRAEWSTLYELREALGIPNLTVRELVSRNLLAV
jgi:hypothetical protein